MSFSTSFFPSLLFFFSTYNMLMLVVARSTPRLLSKNNCTLWLGGSGQSTLQTSRIESYTGVLHKLNREPGNSLDWLSVVSLRYSCMCPRFWINHPKTQVPFDSDSYSALPIISFPSRNVIEIHGKRDVST